VGNSILTVRRMVRLLVAVWRSICTQRAQPSIEALVIRSVRDHLKPSAPIDDRSLVDTHVARVEVQPEQLVIQLAQPERTNRKGARAVKTLRVPWHKTPSKRRREILLPHALDPQHARPIRSETRATLVASIARGRRWLNELVDDAKASVESIAKRERCSVRQVNMTISLAFIAPDLVKAAIEGRLTRGIGVTRLRDAPVEWSSPTRNARSDGLMAELAGTRA
jgi:hypothetical protein